MVLWWDKAYEFYINYLNFIRFSQSYILFCLKSMYPIYLNLKEEDENGKVSFILKDTGKFIDVIYIP